MRLGTAALLRRYSARTAHFQVRFQVRSKVTLTNKLGQSRNPYLKSHENNPIAWQEWSQETLDLAKQSDRPILLSIGYYSCHWCHVMNRESFSSARVAELVNNNFVPIKIDREEWPDIDSIYMMYLQATHGSGGWPLNVFLDPDTLGPFLGGTYWAGPDVAEDQVQRMKAARILDILSTVSHEWTNSKDQCKAIAAKVGENLSRLVDSKSSQPPQALERDALASKISQHFMASRDPVYGGFGEPPKFPLPTVLRFLLDHKPLLDPQLGKFASYTLQKIFKGGIKDQIGHGVSRYSVGTDWHLPHFEKMLYDQALLLETSLRDPTALSQQMAHDLCDFLIKAGTGLRSPTGAWYSAVDADSVNEDGTMSEGSYYLWTANEIQAALRHRDMFDADVCMDYWGVEPNGNISADLNPNGEFTYKNTLSVYKSVEDVAAAFGKKPRQVEKIIRECTLELRKWREVHRIAPQIDEKVVTGWNGLTIAALTQASWRLDRPDALEAAILGAAFLKNVCWDGSTLYRTPDKTPSVLDDYANTVSAMLDLYEATFDVQYLNWAVELQQQQQNRFGDPRGGYFTSQNWDWLVYRPKSGFDTAEPSGNAVSARNLVRLGRITLDNQYLHTAQRIFDNYSQDMAEQPAGYLSLISPFLTMNQPQTVVLVGDDASRAEQLVPKVREFLKQGYSVVRVDKDSVPFLPNYSQIWSETQETQLIEVADVLDYWPESYWMGKQNDKQNDQS